jgi:hypothetical protein
MKPIDIISYFVAGAMFSANMKALDHKNVLDYRTLLFIPFVWPLLAVWMLIDWVREGCQ